MVKIIIFSLLISSLTSCSFFKKRSSTEEADNATSVEQLQGAEGSLDEQMFADETSAEDLNLETAAPEGEQVVEQSAPTPTAEAASDALSESVSAAVTGSAPDASGMQSYTATESETLMWIAFKLYGNYGKWRDLAKWNQLDPNKRVEAGQVVKYQAGAKKFVWKRPGNPYIIRIGDTLAKISNHLYQSSHWWKKLWTHNKQMIKNPNLIFAGFTLYYPDKADLQKK